jgi:hypothetical protein
LADPSRPRRSTANDHTKNRIRCEVRCCRSPRMTLGRVAPVRR